MPCSYNARYTDNRLNLNVLSHFNCFQGIHLIMPRFHVKQDLLIYLEKEYPSSLNLVKMHDVY